MAAPIMDNEFCWNELATNDSARCEKFYTSIFGWTAATMPMGPTSYTIFRQGDKQFGGMIQMTPEWGTMRPHWMAYISVANVDACAQKIVEQGGKVCVPPTDISVGRFAVVEDPAGGAFSIIKLKPQP